MKPTTAVTLSWVLTYAGLLLAALGLFVRAGAPALATTCWWVGGALVVAGGVMVYVRSRMPP